MRIECNSFDKPRKISERLLDVAENSFHFTQALSSKRSLKFFTLDCFLFAIMIASGVTKVERGKLLEQWERVTFRIFGLARKDSRTKVGDYVRLAYKIVTEDMDMRTYNQIMAGLHELGKEYPIDEALREGLLGKDCYERPEVCRYLLWSYEEHLAKLLGAGATVDEHERSAIWKLRATESIEHIFPQSWNIEWAGQMRDLDGVEQPLEPNVGRIGNLLLLPMPLNQEAEAAAFAEKKKVYEKHNLRMVQEVSKESEWTLAQIQNREARIAEFANTRWADI